MRGRRFISVLSVGAAALLVSAGAGTADAAPTNWLKAYQAQFQDPQADLSGVDIPPPAGTDAHSGHHGSSTTGEYASGFTALPPETGGQWDYLPSFPPEFNALHVVAGPNGKILLVAGSGKNKANFTAGTFTSYIWNPVTDERRLIPTPRTCSAPGTPCCRTGARWLAAERRRTDRLSRVPRRSMPSTSPPSSTNSSRRSRSAAGTRPR
ncbi:MAG: hypothetical protein WKF47_19630 [Geodermatophilaceae bacterium]